VTFKLARYRGRDAVRERLLKITPGELVEVGACLKSAEIALTRLKRPLGSLLMLRSILNKEPNLRKFGEEVDSLIKMINESPNGRRVERETAGYVRDRLRQLRICIEKLLEGGYRLEPLQ